MATVKRTPLIAGNWKMNLDHLQSIAFVQKLAWTLKDAGHQQDASEVVVFPPFTDLRSVQTLVSADKLAIGYGAQDLSEHDSGAYTGEISGAFLSALDCTYVIVGHSERRTLHGETDEELSRKVAAAIRHGLVPVLCVGETAEDLAEHGPSAVPVAQLKASSTASPARRTSWSHTSRSGRSARARPRPPSRRSRSPPALRAALAELYGQEVADATRILYGGSVKAANIASFMREADLDGALVGGASLDVTEFASIARFQHHVGT